MVALPSKLAAFLACTCEVVLCWLLCPQSWQLFWPAHVKLGSAGCFAQKAGSFLGLHM
jgi:hypothetical protein